MTTSDYLGCPLKDHVIVVVGKVLISVNALNVAMMSMAWIVLQKHIMWIFLDK